MSWLRHAFAVDEPPADDAAAQAEDELFGRVARAVVKRGLTSPALLFLELHRPLGYVTGQMLHSLGPFASLVANPKDVEILASCICRRGGVTKLIAAIEDEDARRTS